MRSVATNARSRHARPGIGLVEGQESGGGTEASRGTRTPRAGRAMASACLLIAAAWLCASPAPAVAQAGSTMDFSGLDRFLDIQERLARDVEPDTAAWRSLFTTPGYAALRERERRWRELDEAFRLAYMPSRRASADSAIAAGGFPGVILPHLKSVPRLSREMAALRQRLERGDALAGALDRVRRFMPAEVVDATPMPPVSFVIFAADGRGYPNRIIADLAHLTWNPDPAGFFAHEFFHYYLRRVPVVAIGWPEAAEPLSASVYNVYEEGIADQLDKAHLPSMTDVELRAAYPDDARRAFYESYRAAVAQPARSLELVSSSLERFELHPDSGAALGLVLQRELPIGGRPLGAYMAAAIREERGDSALASVVGDPLGFWLLYDDVAAAGGRPRLGARALAVLRAARRGEQRRQDRHPGFR